MEGISKEAFDIIYALLPGFIAAWVFYGLTPHEKPPPFERVIQALIFTILVKASLVPTKMLALYLGHWHSFGDWTDDVGIFYSVVLGLVVGMIAARLANNNTIHECLRDWKMYTRLQRWWNRLVEGRGWLTWLRLPKWKWTSRTSAPSEWFAAFNERECYVVLHLKGRRRIHAWMEQWPDQPDRGYFVLMEAEWLLEDGRIAPLYNVDRLLVAAEDVEMVELLKPEADCEQDSEKVAAVQKTLISIQSKQPEKGENDGSEVSTAAAAARAGGGQEQSLSESKRRGEGTGNIGFAEEPTVAPTPSEEDLSERTRK